MSFRQCDYYVDGHGWISSAERSDIERMAGKSVERMSADEIITYIKML